METKRFEVESSESNIDWTGKKVTGAHNGTIDIKTGELTVQDGNLSGGNFIIDTTSIKILDITDPDTNQQFAGHLFSADFFSTENFPEASFVITTTDHLESDSYLINGDLTIKGITHGVTFGAQVAISGNKITASGKVVVDRTRYEMKFRSGNFFTNLGDTLIYNEFELDVQLTAFASL
ncbi:YceI family protein [Dyadobacter endophyticus]|uniref:Lipid-binding protein n=1 Tax=Dyadobacter endophyticus TaxID=1749036 RepID=A0ABQ1Z5R7_9BACT|nr:YceI family protein [Dyadobacter endophyticus]GGH51360.1 lipid-binding protein [Dyadobacter endophyticus]